MSTAQAPHAPGSLAPGASLVHALPGNWWLAVLRGVAAIIFGILAFAWPGITLVTLVSVLGRVRAGRRRAGDHRGRQGRQSDAALVARHRRPRRHRRRRADVPDAGAHRAGAGDLHRGVGDRARRDGDLRRDQAAQGDRRRVVPDPQRRALGACSASCCCGGRASARSRWSGSSAPTRSSSASST